MRRCAAADGRCKPPDVMSCKARFRCCVWKFRPDASGGKPPITSRTVRRTPGALGIQATVADERRRNLLSLFSVFFFRRRKFVTTACRMVSFLAHADEEGLRLLKNLVTAIVESLPKVTPRCGPRKNVSLRLLFLLRMPVRLPLPFVQRLTWGNRAENKTGLKSLNSRAVSRNECPALITLRRFRPLV